MGYYFEPRDDIVTGDWVAVTPMWSSFAGRVGEVIAIDDRNDPSRPAHKKLKTLIFYMVRLKSCDRLLPEETQFRSSELLRLDKHSVAQLNMSYVK
jgi:hypothetical protein